MSARQDFEFEASPRKNRFGEPVGMRIKFELGDDADLIITGTATGAQEGTSYTGTLTLRRERGGSGLSVLEGGDECWVNGVWVSPCPSEEVEGDEPETSGTTDDTKDEE